MVTVATSWQRVLQWYTLNAPTRSTALLSSSAATDAEIEAVEKVIGNKLPDDVRQSYRIYNGSNGTGVFEYGYYLLSLEEILHHWSAWRRLVNEGVFSGSVGEPQGPIRTTWWNTNWVPFTDNGGGDHDCIDMDPAPGGAKGQIIEFSHENGARRVSGTSFREWIMAFAQRLEAGQYRFEPEGGALLPVNEQE